MEIKSLINSIKKEKSLLVYVFFWMGIASLLIVKYILTTNLGKNENFLSTYKYMSSDSYDWVANGLLLFRSDLISFRNPGLPLIIKGLYSLNLLRLLPLLNHLIFLGIMVSIFQILKKVFKMPAASYIVVLFIFLNYSFQNFASYILADYYAIFFIASSVYFLLVKNFKVSLFLLGISTLFQNFSFFLMPLWFIYIYSCETDTRNIKELINPKGLLLYIRNNFGKLFIYLIIALNFHLLWFVYKLIKFNDPLYTGVQQLELLSPNFNSLLFYIVNTYTLFGIIFYIVVLFLVAKFRTYRNNVSLLFLLGLFLFTLIFWCIFYEWNDRRFLLYLMPFFYPIFGYFLEKSLLRLKVLLQVVIFVVVVYSTTLPLSTFFTSNTIPLTNWDFLVFEAYSDDTAQSFIKFPLTYERRETHVFSVINPTYAQLIKNYNHNKFNTDTYYSAYSLLIEESYDRDLKEVCVGDQYIDYYTLNSIFLIHEGEPSTGVLFKTDCY